jgi:hypothetical protein
VAELPHRAAIDPQATLSEFSHEPVNGGVSGVAGGVRQPSAEMTTLSAIIDPIGEAGSGA